MFLSVNMGGSHDALRGDGVPLTNARAWLMTPTALTWASVELMMCVRVIAQEVFVPWFSTAYYLKQL